MSLKVCLRLNATIVFLFGIVPNSEDVLLASSHVQIQSKSVSEIDGCFCMLRGGGYVGTRQCSFSSSHLLSVAKYIPGLQGALFAALGLVRQAGAIYFSVGDWPVIYGHLSRANSHGLCASRCIYDVTQPKFSRGTLEIQYNLVHCSG